MEQNKDAARREQNETVKQPYTRPELVKHGNVEEVTQQPVQTGPSGPIID